MTTIFMVAGGWVLKRFRGFGRSWNDEFVEKGNIQILLETAGVALLICAGVFLPLALLLERWSRSQRPAAFVVPVLFVVAALCGIVVRLALTQDFWDAFFGRTGQLLALAVAFSVYWAVLCSTRYVSEGVRSFGSRDRESR